MRAVGDSPVTCLGGKEEKNVLGGCPQSELTRPSQPVESIDSSRVCPLLDCGDDVLICVSRRATFLKIVLHARLP